MSDPRYPIGKFLPIENPTDADREAAIAAIEAAPAQLRAAVTGLSDEQLGTPYRDRVLNARVFGDDRPSARQVE